VSVYRKPRSPYFHFDFQWHGHRFHGSTKTANRRQAEKVEAAEREKAKRRVAQIESARTSLRLQDVATRYWTEIGEHLASSQDTWHQFGKLITFFGPDKLLTEIASDDVARMVAWRRGQPGRRTPLLSPYTVNATIKALKKLFTRAKQSWGVRFEYEPSWRDHWLKEPEERVRELVGDEGERFEAATRADYLPIFRLAQATGMRQNECLLRWPEVDFTGRQIRKHGKGGRLVTRPITPTVREILWPLQGHHPDFVFTFVATRTTHRHVRGKRYPITYSGLRSHWRYLRQRAGVVDFRFHDFRHDFGTKLLRVTGNLKLVQKTLNHASIKTTTRYTHVLDAEVADGMEAVAKSRTRSRAKLKIVS
jgi:integrase